MNAITVIQRPKGEMNWNIIDLARKDGPHSLNPEGFLARLARGIFGIPVPRRLGNDGLEALRRFSVRAWFWDFIRRRDLIAFLDAGYTMGDARRILSYIAHHRGFTPSIVDSRA